MNKTKLALSIAMLATLTAGCSSDDDKPSIDSTTNDTSCSVEEKDDGTVIIECPDGSSVTVKQGEDGKDGRDGEDGEDGARGKNGEAGDDGARGKAGEDGAQGEAGEDGARGQDGEPGEDGSQGDPGLDGTPGEHGLDGEPGQPGEAGTSCSVECLDKHTARIFCEDGKEVSYQVESCRTPPVNMLSSRGGSGCWIQPTDQRLVCWGYNNNWTLGNGPYLDNQESPNLVETRQLKDGLDTRWRHVDSSTYTTCGITLSGEGYCWGSSAYTIGNGGIASDVPSPIDITGLPAGTTWSVISTGQANSTFSCGVTTQGSAYCWGVDSSGQLGNGAISGTQALPSAVDVSGLSSETTWTTISTGDSFVCGLTSEGAAYCWGSDTSGRLGNGALTGSQVSPSAVDVSGLPAETTWEAISAGATHACALTTEGAAYCWGRDTEGQLGNGALGAATTPSPVDMTGLPEGLTWTQLSAGYRHSCGLTSDGTAWCWGNRASGRLGDGSAEEGAAQSPVAVDVSVLPAGTTWKSLSAGVESSCGLTTSDEVYCWGNDTSSQLGNGAAVSEPQLKPEHRVHASIGVLPGRLEFSGELEANNLHQEFAVLPPDGSSEELTVTVTSSDEAIIPSANITVLGTGRERSLSLEPIASGLATITVVVTSSTDEISFTYAYGASAAAVNPAGVYHHHIADASTAIDVGGGYVLLADDTTNTVSLYTQEASGLPLKVWDFSAQLGSGNVARGIESAARTGDTIVWALSHANRLSDGAVQERQRAIFATTISGSGADVELSFTGRYGGGGGSPSTAGQRGLWLDLISWDQADGHGLGANALGFAGSTLAGVIPTAPNGLSIEGLEFAADGMTGYLGFRAPTISVSGTQHALIVPVTNMLDLVDEINEVSGLGQFGAPILLDLAGRSIREMRRNASGEYLISAGPPDNATPGVNDTWALYTWAGAGQAAVFNRALPNPNYTTGGDWESIVSVPNPLQTGGSVRLVTDSGAAIFYGASAATGLELGLQKSYSQLFTLQ